MSFGRPLGQCCRNSRQHCTGLALWTPGSPLRCLPAREPLPRHALPFQQSPARAQRALIRATPTRCARDAWAAPHGAERAKPGCRGARAQCNAAGSFGSIGRAVARRGSPVREPPRTEPRSPRSPPSPRAPQVLPRDHLRRAIAAQYRSLPIAHSASPRRPPTGPTPRRPRPRAATSARRPASARAP